MKDHDPGTIERLSIDESSSILYRSCVTQLLMPFHADVLFMFTTFDLSRHMLMALAKCCILFDFVHSLFHLPILLFVGLRFI